MSCNESAPFFFLLLYQLVWFCVCLNPFVATEKVEKCTNEQVVLNEYRNICHELINLSILSFSCVCTHSQRNIEFSANLSCMTKRKKIDIDMKLIFAKKRRKKKNKFSFLICSHSLVCSWFFCGFFFAVSICFTKIYKLFFFFLSNTTY